MQANLKKLIQVLNKKKFYSMAQLCERLDLSRKVILALFKQLKLIGLQYEFDKKKGYRLRHKINFLNLKKIKKYISKKHLKNLKTIEIFDEIDSTNNYLIQSSSIANQSVAICLAEYQTAGKGRLGKKWYSPYGANIYFSMRWPFNKGLSQLTGLSLVIATIVAELLDDLGVHNGVELKWPNDIYWNQHKLAGILIEIAGEANGAHQVVIGIGINMQMSQELGKSIDLPWTCFKDISIQDVTRNKIVGMLMNKLMNQLPIFEKEGLAPFLKLWRKKDLAMNQPVKIISPNGIIEGVGKGVDKLGRFKLEDKDGNTQIYSTGEVSLRLKD